MPRINVSVIVPAFNHARFLGKRIESILNQSFSDFELILLDDCSTDDSAAILKTFEGHPKVSHVVRNTVNSGSPFKQWIKGASLSRGEYIWIAESDDLADAEFLSNSRFADADFTFSKIVDIDDSDAEINVTSTWLGIFREINWSKPQFFAPQEMLTLMKSRNVIVNASSLVFRKCFLENLKNEICDFRYCGDWMLYLRAAQAGALFQYSPSIALLLSAPYADDAMGESD